MTGFPRFIPVADHAVLVEFAESISDGVTAQVHALDRALAFRRIPGLVEVVPAYVSLLVDFDPLVTDHRAIEAAVRLALESHVEPPGPPVLHEATICVDADFGPDLERVSSLHGLTVDDVVTRFLGATYRVAMYGFAPGYAYLAGVDPEIHTPRKSEPVRGVPAGSVIIAGPQCLITTLDMPTGWSVIGRSTTRVLRPESDQPFLFRPGDEVRFRRISASELVESRQR